MQEDPYYGGAPMGLGAGSSDFLPPPRNGPRSGSAGSTDNINMANGYGAPQQPGTSYYGSTVVGDYDYLPPHTQLPPQPGPMQDDARNALLAQQQAEFGIHMYDAVTPADGPEIRRLMSEGYTEDDAIQMLFDFRYRHQSGRSQPYGMQLQPPMPAPQSPRQVGSGMSVGGGGPRQAPLSRGPSLNSHSTGDLYSPQAAEQHRRLQHDDGHSHSMYVGQQSVRYHLSFSLLACLAYQAMVVLRRRRILHPKMARSLLRDSSLVSRPSSTRTR